MRILAIVNNKGGVGKTTTAQNLGAALARFSKPGRVLIVDLDPQGSLSKSFGMYIKEDELTSGSWILKEQSLLKVKKNYNNSNIDIVPSSNNLIVDEERMQKSPLFPFNLKKVLKLEEANYDFVILDCPPALSILTKIALISCHRYYIPLQAEFLSYEGLRSFINYANEIMEMNPDMDLGGVFATRFNPKVNKKFSKKLIESVSKQLGDKFLDSFIRENGDLYQAQATGTHIFDYDDSCNGAVDYYNLAKEILLKY